MEGIQGRVVWVLQQNAGGADVEDWTFVHATEAGAIAHMYDLFADLRITIQADRLNQFCPRLDRGPDTPAPTWFAMEPGENPFDDEEWASWSIERQRIYQ